MFNSKRLLRILEIIYSNVQYHILQDNLLYLLEHFYHFERVNLILFNQNAYPVFLASKNMDQNYISLYKNVFYKKDVFIPSKVENLLKDRFVLTYPDVTNLREFKKGEYYNDFIIPQQIEEMLMITIPLGSNQSFVIGIACSIGDRSNSDLVQELNFLARHLRVALNNAKQFEISEKIRGLLDAFSHCTSTGIVLLNNQLEPIFFTKNASIYYQLLGGSITFNEGLLTVPPLIKTLCDQVRRRLGCTGIQSLSSKITHNIQLNDQNLELEVHPFSRFFFSSGESYLLLIKGRISLNEYCQRTLQDDYKLTIREIEIISMVLWGYTNVEIADRLCISLPTVKGHIQNIFEKMQVKNRTSLTYKIIHILYQNLTL